MKNKRGFSLIETLVVIGIFAVLATLAAESTVLSLRGARKADSISEIRDNLDFAIAVIERQTRNAQDINDAIVPCDGSTQLSFNYIDQDEVDTSFSCEPDGFGDFYIASGSARLTSSEVRITNCEFICIDPGANLPKSIDIKFTGQKTGVSGSDQSTISVDTRVMLRAY